MNQFYLSHNGRYNFCCTPCDKERKVKYRAENKDKIAIANHKYINTERGYDELMLYIQDYGRNCEYCRKPWTYQRDLGVCGEGHTRGRRSGIETNFSIDRLDTTLTYSRHNIVFCCVGCNNRKNQVRLSDIVNITRVLKERKNNDKEI